MRACALAVKSVESVSEMKVISTHIRATTPYTEFPIIQKTHRMTRTYKIGQGENKEHFKHSKAPRCLSSLSSTFALSLLRLLRVNWVEPTGFMIGISPGLGIHSGY